MEFGKVANVKKPVSRFAMGTFFGFTIGEPEEYFDILDAAVSVGINTMDTAQAYKSEPVVGAWMKARGNREDIVVVTKGAHPSRYRKRVHPYDITSDLMESLAELETDYIDIYMLHRDDEDLPVELIVDTLNEHVQAGRILSYGGSNWTTKRLAEANAYAEKNGLQPFTSSSPHFSLAQQFGEPWAPGCVAISGPEGEAERAWYKQNQMPVFAYSSLARGIFSGRITREMFEKTPEQIESVARGSYCHELNFKRLDRVQELAKERNVEPAQIAMAYVFCEGMNTFAITGAQNKTELESSVKALDIKLSKEEVEWLDLRVDNR